MKTILSGIRVLALGALLALIPAAAKGESPATRTGFHDMGAARDYFDAAMPLGVEGIWEFPDDNTRVAVVDKGNGSGFDIILIESPDCRLTPGQIVGHLSATPLSGKYSLSLYRSFKGDILSDITGCAAEFNQKEQALIIHPPKLKFSLRTSYFLPKLWRILRLSLDNPAAELPKGMVRIYPPYSSRKSLVYY